MKIYITSIFPKPLLQAIMLLTFILMVLPSSLSAQYELKVGEKVSEVAKNFDHFAIYKNEGQEWDQVVFEKYEGGMDFGYYAYCDQQGQIRMVLPKYYGFKLQEISDVDTIYYRPTSYFHEGLAVVLCDSNRRFGIVDMQGRIVVEGKYSVLDRFSEGLAFFADITPCNGPMAESGTVGYLNKQGEVAFTLPAKFSTLYGCCYFHGDLFKGGKAVMFTRQFGYDCNSTSQITVNKAGEIIEYDGELLDPAGNPVKID